MFIKSNKTSNWNICPRVVGPEEMCVQKADVPAGKPEWRMQNWNELSTARVKRKGKYEVQSCNGSADEYRILCTKRSLSKRAVHVIQVLYLLYWARKPGASRQKAFLEPRASADSAVRKAAAESDCTGKAARFATPRRRHNIGRISDKIALACDLFT